MGSPKALDYFQKAVAVYETLADEGGLANALRGIGNVESTFGNYEKAIAAFRRSLALFEKTGDRAGQSSVNSSLNIVYQNIGDFERAFEYRTRALALARETGDKNSLGAALSNLANLMNSRGNHESALRYNEETLQIFEQQNNAERVALTLNNVGNTYLQQNDFSVAESYFRRGLQLREKIGDRDGVARSNLKLGELMISQANYAAASPFLTRSVELRETEAKEPANLASALARLGDVYFKQNDLPKAGDYYRRALPIVEAIGEKEMTAAILVAAARFHLANGERKEAAAKINRAVEIAAALNLRETLWDAQTVAGEIALAKGDKMRARQNFEAAIKTVEDARLLIAGGECERQRFFESKTKPYHRLVELLVADKKYEEAFAYAERAKARVLLDVLQSGGAVPNKAMTEPERAQEMNLKANIVVLSACETARGRIGQGEGLIGLSWAFFVAGSPTTVASQWKVESASTSETMLGFYRQMRKNSKPVSKAEALRQSSLALLKSERYAHPFYWAGFRDYRRRRIITITSNKFRIALLKPFAIDE